MSQTNTVSYTTIGDVRGMCGHAHRTISAALDCTERDRRACAYVGGYSDRVVARYDGEELTDAENDAIHTLTTQRADAR